MTKKLRIILVSIVAIIALLVSYTVIANKTPTEEENKSDLTLWERVDYMDSLRDLKAECADNLNIQDSAKFLMWETWYCDSWDEEILSLREQINLMQKKDYETARGLIKSRQAQ